MAASPLVVECTITIVSSFHGSPVFLFRTPPQRSTTFSPRTYAQTAPPSSRRLRKFSANASRTPSKPQATAPPISCCADIVRLLPCLTREPGVCPGSRNRRELLVTVRGLFCCPRRLGRQPCQPIPREGNVKEAVTGACSIGRRHPPAVVRDGGLLLRHRGVVLGELEMIGSRARQQCQLVELIGSRVRRTASGPQLGCAHRQDRRTAGGVLNVIGGELARLRCPPHGERRLAIAVTGGTRRNCPVQVDGVHGGRGAVARGFFKVAIGDRPEMCGQCEVGNWGLC